MVEFISYAHEAPPLTGSRHWYDLSCEEQDDFLLACFSGPNVRHDLEKKLDLYDRIGLSLAHSLLGDDFYEHEPRSNDEKDKIMASCTRRLSNSILGERLIRAQVRNDLRRSGKHVGTHANEDDPMLVFEYLDAAKTRGFEYLSFDCAKDIGQLEKENIEDFYKMPLDDQKESLKELKDAVEIVLGANQEEHTSRGSEDNLTDFFRNNSYIYHKTNVSLPIDLVDMGRRIPWQYKGFSKHIVFMLCDQVKHYKTTSDLKVIRDCTKSLIRNLKWREFFFFRRCLECDHKDIEYLANSAVLTALRYQYSLQERETGLAQILRTEFNCGFELMCHSLSIGRYYNNAPVITIGDIQKSGKKWWVSEESGSERK